MNTNNLPAEYLERMRTFLQDEYEDYISSLYSKSLSGIRINTLKTSNEVIESRCDGLEKIPWISNGYICDNANALSHNPYYFAGLYYIQEPSAMIPAAVLGTQMGEYVLDMCAAPGGKSTQIACDLNGSGLLVSNDISASRSKALLKNLELFGAGNILLSCEDPKLLACLWHERFHRILLDAPCSGEGMFRKSPAVVKSYIEHGADFYVELQKQLLENAYTMLKYGGTLVYSTCTFNPHENEENIIAFLEKHDDMYVDDIDLEDDFVSSDMLKGSIRAYPHRITGEGHFICRLKKKGEYDISEYTTRSFQDDKITQSERDFIDRLDIDYSRGYFKHIKDYLYFIPNTDMVDKNIRFLRTGLLMGEVKKEAFKPSQALAMHLKKEDYEHIINFAHEDPRVIKYLKGETIEADTSHKGYALVCVDDYPLGWVKQDGMRCKNQYLPGWRMQ